MPEGYTHFRVAAKAAAAVRYRIKWPQAFAAGANGPDIFFCYEVWRKAAKRHYDLPALGTRLHEDNTGAFLQSLVRHARTAPQVEYVLGFLSHYAADTVIHPYVAALCQPGMPYAEPGGHGYFEIALDSTLHKQDTGSGVVPAVEACPTPGGSALADIVALLHTALLETYGLDIPAEYLADSFFQSTKLRGLFTSRFGVRRALFGLIEPLFGGRGKITGHVSPRELAPDLPAAWTDPYSGEAREDDIDALLTQAQERSKKYMAAAILVWMGRQPMTLLAETLGSNSYSEGRPTPQSDPNYAPPEPQPAPQEPGPSPEPANEPPAPQPAVGPAPTEPAEPAPPAVEAELPDEEAAPPADAQAEAAPAVPVVDEEELLAEGLAMIEAARQTETEPEVPPTPEQAADEVPIPEPEPEPAPNETPAPEAEPAPEQPPASEPVPEQQLTPDETLEPSAVPEPTPGETGEPAPEAAPVPARDDPTEPEPAPDETSAPEPAPDEAPETEPTPEGLSEPAPSPAPAPGNTPEQESAAPAADDPFDHTIQLQLPLR